MAYTNGSICDAIQHMKHLLKHGAREGLALRQACGKYRIPYTSQAASMVKREARELLRKERP